MTTMGKFDSSDAEDGGITIGVRMKDGTRKVATTAQEAHQLTEERDAEAEYDMEGEDDGED